MQGAVQFISGKLQKLEARFGLFFSSVIIAAILMIIAMIYVQPVFTVAFHGLPFSSLSENPFDLSTPNPLRYRILTPLIGYLLFLRGDNFYLLPFMVTCIFPAVVYFQYRRKLFTAIDSFILTCFITFSCVVLIPLVAPAYTDIVTWLFIFLAFIRINKVFMSAFFFALALLNHESSIVMIPGLLFYCYIENNKKIFRYILLILVACIPHLCYRWYVHANADTAYNLSFYLSKGNIFFTLKKLILYGPAAVFYAFKLWWIVPIYFIVWSAYLKKYLQLLTLLFLLAGAFSLVIIGYDYTRMLVIVFPVVLLSYEWMIKIFNPEKLRKYSVAIIALNFLILQYHFNYDGAQPMFPWLLNKISEMLGMPIY